MNTKIAMLASAVALATSGAVLAQEGYPSQPVTIVVSYPAGGGTDIIGRLFAEGLAERLGGSFLVDNRPGASGMIGAEFVARAQPDGYTILYTAADTNSINPHVHPSIRYDGLEDFTPIARTGLNPFGLVMAPGTEVTTIDELRTYVEGLARPFTYASWGIGSSSHVAMERFLQTAGIKGLHIPYQGAAPAMTAVMGGEVDATMSVLTLSVPNHVAGAVNLVAVTTEDRTVIGPEFPTLREVGVDVAIAPWMGFLGPKGMDPAVVKKLEEAVMDVANDPALAERFIQVGLDVGPMNSEDFGQYLIEQYELWGDTVREAGIIAN